ncbi:MAG: hypothetical protein HY735_08365 [Verrucomicrobia bacterium]|nr:hypothetical protein [Verrucomicrobiota bacterium]
MSTACSTQIILELRLSALSAVKVISKMSDVDEQEGKEIIEQDARLRLRASLLVIPNVQLWSRRPLARSRGLLSARSFC